MKNKVIISLLLFSLICYLSHSTEKRTKKRHSATSELYPIIDPKKYKCPYGCSECKGRCCYSGYCLSTNSGGYSCMYFCKQPDITNFDLVPRFKSKVMLFKSAKEDRK